MQGLRSEKPVLERIQLSKDLSHQIPWSTECLTPFWTPAGVVGMSTAAAAQGLVSAEADGKGPSLVVDKALVKWKIVADKTKFITFQELIVVI